MSLEKDIQQPKFRNEFQKLAINIIFTHNYLSELNRQLFDSYDITPQQFNILRILRGAGKPLSTLQIRKRMLDKMSDTSRIVDRLVKKEMVKKVLCNEDRRLVDVTITQKGLDLLQELDGHSGEMDASVSSLTEQEARTMNQLLDKIRGSVS